MDKNKKQNGALLKKLYTITFFVLLTLGISTPFFMKTVIRRNGILSYMPFVIGDIIVLLSIIVLWIFLSMEHIEKEMSLYEKYLIKELDSKESDENERNVILLMYKNNKEITEYFRITKKQEKISYNISICCSIFGFIMLVVAIIGVLYSARIEITAITVASGALTEVVSGIVLWIHGKSASQLNHYYESLHENEKFLSAINLADKLDDTEKKEMYMEIIKAQIRSNEENKETENRG